MGAIWLTELDRWLIDAGLNVSVYDDQWKTRARSSGGYEDVRGIGIHHDASSIGSSEKSACDWGWKNSDSRPIGCIRLARDGHITVGAAGATNTMGKGGPLTGSRGTIPRDQGNLYMVAIEAANNGVGEMWGRAMMDAYLLMVHTLCARLGLRHTDVFGHYGYCLPTCPGRKIDPFGPAEGYPNLGTGIWPDAKFRGYLDAITEPTPPPPEIEDTDMLFICRVNGVIYVGDGARATEVPAAGEATIETNIRSANRWHQPARAGLPLVKDMGDIVSINATQRDILVGKLT